MSSNKDTVDILEKQAERRFLRTEYRDLNEDIRVNINELSETGPQSKYNEYLE